MGPKIPMNQINQMSWKEAKHYYKHNLNTLKTSINVVQNSTEEMNKIYNQVIRKANNTSSHKLQKFANLWTQKIDLENLEDSELLKKSCQKLLYEPSPEDFTSFVQSLQQRTYKKSIPNLDSYKTVMESFYSTWNEMWPLKEK